MSNRFIMTHRRPRASLALALIALAAAPPAVAQAPGAPTTEVTRLRETLPPDVARRVIPIVEAAGARGLPTQALASRALEGNAKGVDAGRIVVVLEAQSTQLGVARDALTGGGRVAAPAEVEAGALALGLGIDGATISSLARAAPSGRSLTVPLVVLGSLVERGTPSAAALQQVLTRLQDRAGDRELLDLPAAAARHGPPETVPGAGRAGSAQGAGQGMGQGGGPPAGVPGQGPGNSNRGGRPDPGKP